MGVIKRNSIMALVAVVSLWGVCYYCYNPELRVEPIAPVISKKQSKIITVFIHGSLYPDDSFLETVSLSDLNTILFDTIDDDSEYMKSLKRVRSNPGLYADQIMLAEGLQEVHDGHIGYLCDAIDGEVIEQVHGHQHHSGCQHCGSSKVSQDKAKAAHGAYYAIACYDSLMKRLFPKNDMAYYTFGHLGVLSHRYRASMAQKLYQALFEKVHEAHHDYESVKVVLVTHSHGGSIALNLARAEEEHKKGLIIDELVLLGTPLQHETAPCAYHAMFKRILNCYSLGDTIQGSDVLTTASRKCYKTFATFDAAAPLGKKIYDVQLMVNDDSHAVTHCNMWYMQHHGKKACHIEPLPYAVLAPALIAALDGQQFSGSVRATIRSVKGHLGIEVSDCREAIKAYTTPNAYDIVARLCGRIPNHHTAHIHG